MESPNLVLAFLNKENRPYGLNEIVTKSALKIGKAEILRILEGFVKKKAVMSKEFDGSKIYFAKQEVDAKECKKELQACEKQVASSKEYGAAKQIELSNLDKALKKRPEVKSIEALSKIRDDLQLEVSEMEKNLLNAESKVGDKKKYSEIEAKNITSQYEAAYKTFRKRKLMCNDIMDAMLEGYPKNKKALIEEIGLETDEDAGFSVGQIY